MARRADARAEAAKRSLIDLAAVIFGPAAARRLEIELNTRPAGTKH